MVSIKKVLEQKCVACKKKTKNKIYCSKECYWLSKKGIKHSWGDKIAQKLKGKPKSIEHNKHVSEALTGRKRPEISGIKHPMWKNGKEITKDGYLKIYCPEHPHSHKGKVLEHRLVMERFLGRLLDSSEIVHHLNGNKTDNKIENLMIMARSEHAKEHSLGKGWFGL